MTQIVGTELPYREQIPGELLYHFEDKAVGAGDTVEVNTKGFSSFLLFLKVSAACDITLDAVSPLGSDWDAEYGINSFQSVNEVVKSFAAAGSDFVDLDAVLTTKKALDANFLRFKFSSAVTASFALVGKPNPSYLVTTATIDDLKKWAGTALTGRDISLDLAKLQNLDALLSTRATEATLAKIVPIAKAALFNTALPTAEANWLASDITPTNSPSYLRIYVCVSVAGVLRVARTVGATTITENLNSGNSLVADAAYMFDIAWRSGDSINVRYSVTTGTIKILRIEEIGAAV